MVINVIFVSLLFDLASLFSSIIYTNEDRKTCGQHLLFSWKSALTTIIMLGISILLFGGNLSSELNLIFIYFSS